MILSDNEVSTRLESPLNLINRLQKLNSGNGMELFIPISQRDESPAVLSDDSVKAILDSIGAEDKSLDEAMPDNAAKIKLGIVKSQALDVLHDSLMMLGGKLSEVKPEKLSTIARDMRAILTEDKANDARSSNQVVIYKPIINDISKYDTLVVRE